MESPSQLALGAFVLHIGGRTFGVDQSDATVLGCSLDEVRLRIQRRGKHLLPILTGVCAVDVAQAYLDALYLGTPRLEYFGLSKAEFADVLQSSGAIWAPDGDEAFDDGSHVLQFDVGNLVRIIAFVNMEVADDRSRSVCEEWMDAELFYGILSAWEHLFDIECKRFAAYRQ